MQKKNINSSLKIEREVTERKATKIRQRQEKENRRQIYTSISISLLHFNKYLFFFPLGLLETPSLLPINSCLYSFGTYKVKEADLLPSFCLNFSEIPSIPVEETKTNQAMFKDINRKLSRAEGGKNLNLQMTICH